MQAEGEDDGAVGLRDFCSRAIVVRGGGGILVFAPLRVVRRGGQGEGHGEDREARGRAEEGGAQAASRVGGEEGGVGEGIAGAGGDEGDAGADADRLCFPWGV